MKKYALYIITILAISWVLPMKSQNSNVPINDSEGVDLNILYGRLNNGFTYYIKQLRDAPAVKMNLLVKAGTFNQTKEQSIAAHLIEHLPFRFTKNFLGSNIKLNPKFKKYNLNKIHGRTIMIHTTYGITLPKSASLEAIYTGLLWYKDIGNLDISTYDIQKEAGILRQEALYRSGDVIEWNFANSKRESQVFPCTADISIPFDNDHAISPTQVEKFYTKWYRPDRMGLVIIGNIQDLTVLENKIKSLFSKLSIPNSTNPVCDCQEIYLNSKRKFVITEKKTSGWVKEENPPVEVFLNFRKKDPILSTNYSTKALRHSLIWDVIERLINSKSNTYGLSYIRVNQRKREKPILQISYEDRNGTEKRKIQKTVQLLAQIVSHGIASKELSIIKNNMLQRLVNSPNINSISYFESQIRNHFLYHDILPSNKLDIMKGLIQSMTVSEINKYITENLTPLPDDISLLVPKNNKALTYTEFEVRNWIHKALKKPLPNIPLPDQKNNQLKKVKDDLILSHIKFDKLPLVGISNKEVDQNTGTEIITLDNGIKIVLNNGLTFQTKKGNIKIHGFTPVGAKCFPDEDYFSAINAPSLIQNKSIRKKIRAYIDNFTSGIKVEANLSNLESTFQNIYYNFNHITIPTQVDFKQWKKKANLNYFYPKFSLISNDFLESKQEYVGSDNSPLRATKRFHGIKNTDPKVAFSIYKQLFGNASNYTFIISGNYSNSEIIPLLQKYVGNLPVQENKQFKTCKHNYKVANSSLPTAPIYKVFYLEDIKPVYNLKNVQYELSYIMQSKEDFWDWRERIKLLVLSKIINPYLESLRYEKRAGLYGINFASLSFNYFLRTSKISIHIACQENEIAWLKQECYKIINDIKDNSMTQKEFKKVINNQVLPYFITKSDDKPTNNEIYNYFRLEAPIPNKKEQEEFVRSITLTDIQKTAREYFKISNQYEFVLMNRRHETNLQ